MADLTEEKIADLKEMFVLFDKDGDGAISPKDLGAVMRSIGQEPTEAGLREMVAEVDTTGSGTIFFNEFQNMMSKTMRGSDQDEEIKDSFHLFDSNGDGSISVSELRQVMDGLAEKLTEDELDDIMRELDSNGDGLISYEEFVSVMTSK